MKRLLITLKEKWPEYLLEILVLIIGIYGAFELENWNEDRKDNKQKKVYLTQILANLTDDRSQLDSLVKHTQDVIRRTNLLIESYKSQVVDSKLATHSSGVIAVEKNFNGFRSGMDALLNSGKLDLIPDQLSLDLQLYYEKSEDLATRESMSNQYIRDFYEPHVFKNYAETMVQMDVFDIKKMYLGDTRPPQLVDPDKYLADRLLEVHIIIRNVQSKIEADLYQNLIVQNEYLQQQIKAQLKSK